MLRGKIARYSHLRLSNLSGSISSLFFEKYIFETTKLPFLIRKECYMKKRTIFFFPVALSLFFFQQELFPRQCKYYLIYNLGFYTLNN